MGDTRLALALYRALLRFARSTRDAPFSLRTSDVNACVPSLRTAAPQLLERATDSAGGSDAVWEITRWSFRADRDLPAGEEGAALDRALDACRRLYGDYAALLERMRSTRAEKADRRDVDFHVGQVFTHKKFGYRGVIYGWDRSCERDAEWVRVMAVNPNQVFYHVLPSEDDCVRLFGGVRISKYVAADNVEPWPAPASGAAAAAVTGAAGGRVLHRALESYFSGFSPALGRYIPTPKLQYEYPDAYGSADVEPCAEDSNILGHEELDPESASDPDLDSAAAGAPPR